MNGGWSQRGVGVPALLVGIVLLGLLMGAIYQVLEANQRISTGQREQLRARQAMSDAVDLLAQELREVSTVGGDLITIGRGAILFRAQRAYGLACEVLSEEPIRLTVAHEGGGFSRGDRVFLLMDGDPETSEDDQWHPLSVSEVEDGSTCGEDRIAAQDLTFSTSLAEPLRGGPERGAVVRSWDDVRYEVGSLRGEPYLIREQNGLRSPLVGPLAEDGFEIRYLDSSGKATTVPAEVFTARITLRTQGAREADRFAGDSLTTTVFIRNGT